MIPFSKQQTNEQPVSEEPLVVVKRVGDGRKEIRVIQRSTQSKAYEVCFTAKGKLAQLTDNEIVNVVTEAIAKGLLSGKLKMELLGCGNQASTI